MKWISLILVLVLMGCTKKEEIPETPDSFIPRIPGGYVGVPLTIKPVRSLTSVTNDPRFVRLSWINPSGYEHLEYDISVYRMVCLISDPGCALNQDPDLTAGASKVYSGKGASFEETDLDPGVTFAYFVCVKVEGRQGPCTPINVTPGQVPGGILAEITSQFWEFITMVFGQSRNIAGGGTLPLSVFTLDAGETRYNAVTERVEITGRISMARKGTLMYYADTKNNRVIIFSRSSTACDPLTMSEELYEFCLLSSSTMPYQAINILGQPDQVSSKNCQEHDADATPYRGGRFVEIDAFGNRVYNRCMNKPTSVYVDESAGRVLVVDSGNNRILSYPMVIDDEGCDPNINPLVSSKIYCEATGVYGKQSLSDLNSYSFSTHGDRTFDNPVDVKVFNNDLYVLDSGNHRLIKIQKYTNLSFFNCVPANWNNSFCRFSSALGQPSFFTRESIADLNPASMFVGGVGTESKLVPAYENYLRNHFANPTSFKFSDDGKIIISSFENFEISDGGYTTALKSRIVVFNQDAIAKDVPDCSFTNFNDPILAMCFAQNILGQIEYDTLPRYASGAVYHQIVPYGMDLVTDVDIVDGGMLAVSPINNGVYFYASYSSPGRYTSLIQDPAGTLDSNNRPLPDLKGISSIGIDSVSKRVFVSDPIDSKVYEVNIAVQ